MRSQASREQRKAYQRERRERLKAEKRCCKCEAPCEKTLCVTCMREHHYGKGNRPANVDRMMQLVDTLMKRRTA